MEIYFIVEEEEIMEIRGGKADNYQGIYEDIGDIGKEKFIVLATHAVSQEETVVIHFIDTSRL